MLTKECIEAAVAAGALTPARPTVPWAGQRRLFLMCRPLRQAIVAARQSTDERTIKRWAQLEADIGYFIEGGYITGDRLKQLQPFQYEHWELRSLQPRPSLRVFGRFAMPDVFVGTHVCERPRLGAKWSLSWELEKLACEEHWEAAGLPDPFHADTYEAYVTDNASRRLGVPR
jgi:hypothetical protein